MRKNFYFSRTFRHRKFELSWDVKIQLAVLFAFLFATGIAYITINLVYA